MGSLRRCFAYSISGQTLREAEVQVGRPWSHAVRDIFSGHELQLVKILHEGVVIYPASVQAVVPPGSESIDLLYVQLSTKSTLRIVVGLRASTGIFFYRMPALDIPLPDELDLRTCKISSMMAVLREHRQCCVGQLDAAIMEWLLKAIGPAPIRRRKLLEFKDREGNIALSMWASRTGICLRQRLYQDTGYNSVPCFELASGYHIQSDDISATETFNSLLALAGAQHGSVTNSSASPT